MRAIFVSIVCFSILHAEGRRWKLHPSLDSAVERVKIGEVTSIQGPEPTIAVLDEQAQKELYKSQRANDKQGIQELMDAAKIATLAPGTGVRVLERNESDLDELMDTVHQLMDIDVKFYKNCADNNIRRVRAGLRLEDCGNLTFDTMYNSRMNQCLKGDTPESYVDAHVLVRVRVLDGKEMGKKLWVAYRGLARPSHPDPSPK